MRLIPSDPDVATIIGRIKNGDIDLQPDFQRGEVWSEAKKRRLIDTILRDWHVPPIHVIEVKESSKQEVLDGQQRLVAIRDFFKGYLKIDGHIQPYNERIADLHGKTYEDLPPEWRRRVDHFTIRVFRIVEYEPGEPAELFYRLNQPANLTAAEQRNAFFGKSRNQVKDLVKVLEVEGIDSDFIGFSNSRMAYDDVIARLCYSLERGTIAEKITSSILADRYRSDQPFPDEALYQAHEAIRVLGEAKTYIQTKAKFTKATLYSWLWFIAQARKVLPKPESPKYIGEYIGLFEDHRNAPRKLNLRDSSALAESTSIPAYAIDQLMLIYNDRSSAHVSDIASVVARDIIIWSLFVSYMDLTAPEEMTRHPKIRGLLSSLQASFQIDESWAEDLIVRISNEQWGEAL